MRRPIKYHVAAAVGKNHSKQEKLGTAIPTTRHSADLCVYNAGFPAINWEAAGCAYYMYNSLIVFTVFQDTRESEKINESSSSPCHPDFFSLNNNQL